MSRDESVVVRDFNFFKAVNMGKSESVVARSLILNSTLTELNVRGTGLSDTRTWLMCLSRNSTLTQFHCEGNDVYVNMWSDD